MGRVRPTPGLAFVAAGLGLLGVSAAIEARIVLGGESLVLGRDLTRLALVPWALGLVFFGYALDHPDVLWSRDRGRRALATYLLFADGGIHILAIGEHVNLPVVVFFAVLAPLQLASAWLLLRGGPGIVNAWLIGAIGLIALYVVSRAIGVPFIDAQYRVEPLGILSKAIEILLIGTLLQEIRVSHRASRGAARSRPAA